jgi:hypothetical protein
MNNYVVDTTTERLKFTDGDTDCTDDDAVMTVQPRNPSHPETDKIRYTVLWND